MKQIALMLSLFFWCAQSLIAEERPNFVIFIADDVSWDDFGYVGNPDVQTPRIDSLAENGLSFEQAYLTASSCSPTRNSIFTGRYPHNAGAAELHTSPPEGMLAFPEVFRQHGYYTAHSGKWHSGPYITRGFDRMITEYAEITNSGEGGWLPVTKERPKDKPFLFWFAALDAHRDWGENKYSGTHDPDGLTIPPYLADAPGTRKDLAQYYDEIYRFDRAVDEVLDELDQQGVLDHTVVLVLADNGRAFPHSKTRVNDRGVKTPFILHWPAKIKQPKVSQALVSVIDIAPTFMDLAGIDIPDQFQGHSFRNVIEHSDQAFREHVFAEHNWHDYEGLERMVRKGNFMYIRNSRPSLANIGPADSVSSPSHADLEALKENGELSPMQADLFEQPRAREELYDCEQDPEQWNNLAHNPEYKEVLKGLRTALNTWVAETYDTVPLEITKDWYLRQPHYLKSPHHGIRGTMPGVAGKATTTTNKGPF